MNILITGASGFIGGALSRYLALNGEKIYGFTRNKPKKINHNINYVTISDIGNEEELNEFFSLFKIGFFDLIIHCAGISPTKKETFNAKDYYKVNTTSTEILAKLAVTYSVKKFIFLSSILVNGRLNRYNKDSDQSYIPFRHNDIPNPHGEYAKSKYEAEKKLKDIECDSNLQVTIIRPTFVYGYKSKGGLKKLENLIRRKIPLPFLGINNKISLVCLENLLDLIYVCGKSDKSSGETFLVSDGDDISTVDLIKKISSVIGVKPYIFYLPHRLLTVLGFLFNKSDEIERITSYFCVDISHTKDTLIWKPKYSLAKCMNNMAQKKC